jgi:Uri superfamily endonuclease
MESSPGTYAIVLTPNSERSIKIGKLGMLKLQAGYYIYVGSAFGPGGLAARIAHHKRISQRPRWHIDYLRTAAEIIELWYTYDSRPMEHDWAETLAGAKGAWAPFPGFGSSDCNCKAHLYFFKSISNQSRRSRLFAAACAPDSRIMKKYSLKIQKVQTRRNEMAKVLYEKRGNIAFVTLNRPSRQYMRCRRSPGDVVNRRTHRRPKSFAGQHGFQSCAP